MQDCLARPLYDRIFQRKKGRARIHFAPSLELTVSHEAYAAFLVSDSLLSLEAESLEVLSPEVEEASAALTSLSAELLLPSVEEESDESEESSLWYFDISRS